MTSYINPSTRHGGVQQIVVPERATAIPVDDAPFDDAQHVRVNGEWVPVGFPEIVTDTQAPSPPTWLSSSGVIAPGGNGVDYELTWVAPTTNADANSTLLTDFAYYVVRWRYAAGGPWATFMSKDTSALLPRIELGVDIEWAVLARDTSGNDSTWTTTTFTGLVDDVGPERPSAPILSSNLGILLAAWDGRDHLGAAPSVDFDRVEFFVSATPGGPKLFVGSVSGAGTVIIANVPVGQTRYITSVAIDNSGNVSAWSAEVSATVVGIGGPSIEDLSLTVSKFKTSTHQLY